MPMAIPEPPCLWEVSYAGCNPATGLPPEPLASMPASGVETFERMAAQYLWNWTGQSFGTCLTTIRPCRTGSCSGHNGSNFWGGGPYPGPTNTRTGPWTPVLVGGTWYNVSCGQCGDDCGCGGGAPLRIPGPIASVDSITEDGVLLDPSAYHVDNFHTLVRTDGQSWAPCGLEITYHRGTPVPPGGQIAAGVLAVELAKAACRDNTCQLPSRVQTITRQGVTIAMLDAFDDIDKGHTGIWIIDSWIASVTKPPIRSRVLSPDMPRAAARRKTWP